VAQRKENMKTRSQRLNECARMLYSTMGYQSEEGYDFQTAHHPQERACFAMAVRTFNFWYDDFKKDAPKKLRKK
jgi:hypothetical protein